MRGALTYRAELPLNENGRLVITFVLSVISCFFLPFTAAELYNPAANSTVQTVSITISQDAFGQGNEDSETTFSG